MLIVLHSVFSSTLHITAVSDSLQYYYHYFSSLIVVIFFFTIFLHLSVPCLLKTTSSQHSNRACLWLDTCWTLKLSLNGYSFIIFSSPSSSSSLLSFAFSSSTITTFQSFYASCEYFDYKATQISMKRFTICLEGTKFVPSIIVFLNLHLQELHLSMVDSTMLS